MNSGLAYCGVLLLQQPLAYINKQYNKNQTEKPLNLSAQNMALKLNLTIT